MEPRSAHYHSGLDIRTGGRIGIPVLAPVEGWVQRVRVSPEGYGKAIYLQAADGRVFVFAHLSAFALAIQERISAAWRESRRYETDLWLPPDDLRFAAGDVLALSGATGTGAPHLHLEIRDATGQALNPLRHGLEFEDDIAPRIDRLRVVALSTDAWIERDVLERSIAPGDTLALAGRFALEVEALDHGPNAPFPLMPYAIEASLDGAPHYSLVQDRFAFERSAQMRLEVRRDAEARWLRLQRRAGNELPGRESAGDGSISLAADETLHEVQLRARDAAGNASEASFWLRGRRGPERASPELRFAEEWFELPHNGAPDTTTWRIVSGSDTTALAPTVRRLLYSALPSLPVQLERQQADGAYRPWVTLLGLRGGEIVPEPRALDAELSLLALDPSGTWSFDGGYLQARRVKSPPSALPPELDWAGAAWKLEGFGLAFDRGLLLRPSGAGAGVGLFLLRRDHSWALLDREDSESAWRLDELGSLALCRDRTPPLLGPWRVEGGGVASDGLRLSPRVAAPGSQIGQALYRSVSVGLRDQGAGLDAADIAATVDGRAWPARWDPEDELLVFDFFLDPGPGPHRLEISARDRLGNASQSALEIQVEE